MLILWALFAKQIHYFVNSHISHNKNIKIKIMLMKWEYIARGPAELQQGAATSHSSQDLKDFPKFIYDFNKCLKRGWFY